MEYKQSETIPDLQRLNDLFPYGENSMEQPQKFCADLYYKKHTEAATDWDDLLAEVGNYLKDLLFLIFHCHSILNSASRTLTEKKDGTLVLSNKQHAAGTFTLKLSDYHIHQNGESCVCNYPATKRLPRIR